MTSSSAFDHIIEAITEGSIDKVKTSYSFIENEFATQKWLLTYTAAKYGHLHILKWLREQECEWTEAIVNAALDHNKLGILIYAIINSCPVSPKEIQRLIDNINNLSGQYEIIHKCRKHSISRVGLEEHIAILVELLMHIESKYGVHNIMNMLNNIGYTIYVQKISPVGKL